MNPQQHPQIKLHVWVLLYVNWRMQYLLTSHLALHKLEGHMFIADGGSAMQKILPC